MLEREIYTVDVYRQTSLDDDGNSKEVIEKKINLLGENAFNKDDSVVVIPIEEYKQLTKHDYREEIYKKDEEISKLNNQINILKNSFFDDVFEIKDKINDKNKLIEANDKIEKLNTKLNQVDEERVAIFKELDYKNKMILAYNVELNKSILKAINTVIDEAKNNIAQKNQQLAKNLEYSIEQSKKEVNEKNKAIAYEIKSTVNDMNEQIRNTGIIKMILNKKNINLRVPTEDLLKPFEFNIDINQLLNSQVLELDASEILKEVMPKLPEPFSKYIDTLEEDEINMIDAEKKE